MIHSRFIWKSQFAFCFQIISCVHSLHLEVLPVRIIWSKVNGVLEDFLPDLDLGISQLLDNQCNDMTWVDATTHGHCTTIWSENWSKDLTAGRLTLTSTLTLLRICLPGPSLTHCQTGHDRGFCRQQNFLSCPDSLTSVTWLHNGRLRAPLVAIRPHVLPSWGQFRTG